MILKKTTLNTSDVFAHFVSLGKVRPSLETLSDSDIDNIRDKFKFKTGYTTSIKATREKCNCTFQNMKCDKKKVATFVLPYVMVTNHTTDKTIVYEIV